tara:strand:+ start:173 stop:430 length:258 start_codon:yes stop_codon:yes gene_type:complete
MIRTFKDARTEKVASGRAPKGFPANLVKSAIRKLTMIDSAHVLDDLRSPPGNRQGQHSIRINDQWRICFVWHEGSAENVEIVDYH